MTAGKRYLMFCVAVFAIAAAVTIGLVRLHDARLSAGMAEDHLAAIRAAQRLVETQQTRDLALRAEMIASNQAVVSYLVQALDNTLPGMAPDYASVVDLLEERRVQLGLSMAGILDAQGKLIATTEPLSARIDQMPAFAAAREKQTVQSAVIVDGNRVFAAAIQPLAAYGTSEAYLLVALPLDERFARSIADVGAAQTAVVVTGADGPLIVASTLPQAALFEALPKDTFGAEAALDLRVSGVNYRGTVASLLGDPRVRLLALATPPTQLAASRDARLPIRIGAGLFLISVIVLLVLYWRRVREPLEAMRPVLEHAAQSGDLHMQVAVRGGALVRGVAESVNRVLARGRQPR